MLQADLTEWTGRRWPAFPELGADEGGEPFATCTDGRAVWGYQRRDGWSLIILEWVFPTSR